MKGYSNYRKIDTFNGGDDKSLSFDIYSYRYSRVELDRISKKNGHDIYHQSPIGNLDDLKYTNNVAWAYTVRNVLLNGAYLNRSDSVGNGGVDVFDKDGFGKKNVMDIGTKTYGDLLRGQGEDAVYKVFISDEDHVENLINLFDPSNINEFVQEKFEKAMEFVNDTAPKSLFGFTEVEFGIGTSKIPVVGGNVPYIGKFITGAIGITNDIVGASTFPTFIRCIAIRSKKLKRHQEIHDRGGVKTEYDVGEEIIALQQTGNNGLSVFPTLIIPKWVLRDNVDIKDLCGLLNLTYRIYEERITSAMVFAGYKDSIKIVN